MKNRISNAAGFVAFVICEAKEARAYRKRVAARQAEQKAYDATIAESQAKIGPYKPASIPVQIWA